MIEVSGRDDMCVAFSLIGKALVFVLALIGFEYSWGACCPGAISETCALNCVAVKWLLQHYCLVDVKALLDNAQAAARTLNG